jgi:APA family basic amino acid/polyamine antiporter
VLILYKTQTTWPGLVLVFLGVPVYLVWSRRARMAVSSLPACP